VLITAGFLIVISLLVFHIRRIQKSFKLSQAAAAGDKELAPEPRMFISQRASMSLRMSRLDRFDEVELSQRDKSVAERLSAYSNARRKSEVAREDEINDDIAVEVKKKKDARRQRKEEQRRRASMSSGAGSRSTSRSNSEVEEIKSENDIWDVL
jgi:hypothetical protein